jgi:hypothetical protein
MLLRVLLAEEFDEPVVEDDPPTTEEISVTFSARLLAVHSSASEETRCWSICTSVLAEAVKQLDPQRQGFALRVMHCMFSPKEGRVCSLRAYAELGTTPWPEQVTLLTGFAGAESLPGCAVMTGQPQVIRDSRQAHRFSSGLPAYACSALALPIIHAEQTAGCLLAMSTQPDYFASPGRSDLLQQYAAALLLAFAPEDFYARDALALQTMPSLHDQQPYLATFQQRIIATLKTAFAVNRTLTYPEAQQFVWSEIAEELLHLAAL